MTVEDSLLELLKQIRDELATIATATQEIAEALHEPPHEREKLAGEELETVPLRSVSSATNPRF